MNIIGCAKCILTHGLLATGWIIFFKLLATYSPINIWAEIDSLWLSPSGENLATNLVGELAFHFEATSGEKRVMYTAPYYPDGLDGTTQTKRLSKTIDTASWQKTETDPLTTTYSDKQFKYVVYQDSNGIYMRIFNL
ncbi:MAG: hypothetical protein EOO07_08435 [Chitinophagaceae bacterium]|nr:MAG: hypothetical protein EOO07_08435 [Chitinophagaceae bacterium]